MSEIVGFDNLPDVAFVRIGTVCQLLGGVTPACVWAWAKKGLIPAPVKIGPQITGWRVGDLRRYLAEAAA